MSIKLILIKLIQLIMFFLFACLPSSPVLVSRHTRSGETCRPVHRESRFLRQRKENVLLEDCCASSRSE